MCEKGAEPSQKPGTKRIVGAIADEICLNSIFGLYLCWY